MFQLTPVYNSKKRIVSEAAPLHEIFKNLITGIGRNIQITHICNLHIIAILITGTKGVL